MGKKAEKWVGFCEDWPKEGHARDNRVLPVQQKDGILERIPSGDFV